MSWVMAAAAAVSVAMQIGSSFAEEGSGTQKGLKLGGMGVGMLGGGIGSAIGAGAGAAGGAAASGAAEGAGGGGMLSGLFGGGGGGGMGGMLPGLGGLLGGSGGGSTASMLGPVVPNTPSALEEAMRTVGTMDIPGGPTTPPMPPGMGLPGMGPSNPGTMSPPANMPAGGPYQIPPIAEVPAWKQALATTAQVQDMMIKQQLMNRPAQAQSPHFFIPQGAKAPSLGTPVAKTLGPMERYAMMLRR